MTRFFTTMGLVGTLGGALAFGGCDTMGMGHTQTWTMNTAESVPAAEGQVKVANQKDGNTKVKVEVEHLAPPAMNPEPGSAYVVWIKPPTDEPQNVGILKVGDNRKGELDTKTPFKQFTVMVTLERNPAATIPHGQTVLDTRVTMPS